MNVSQIADAVDGILIDETRVDFTCPHHPELEAAAVVEGDSVKCSCPAGCDTASIVSAIPALALLLGQSAGWGSREPPASADMSRETTLNGSAPRPANLEEFTLDEESAIPALVPEVDSWKLVLHELSKRACDELIAAEAGYRDFISAMPLEAFAETVNKVRNQPAIWQTNDPALSPTEIEEEVYVIARALQKVYAPVVVNGGPPAKPAGNMMWIEDYLTMFAERASRPWIWEETLYAGAFNMLVGRPFSGKSSFAAALLRSVALGEPFMGRRCKPVTSAYLALERNGAVVAKLLGAWDLGRKVLFADEIRAENAAQYIERQVKMHSLGFLVIDHLQHSTKITESSSYSEVSNALMPYQAISRTTGCCILALHHQAKPQQKDKKEEPSDEDPIEVMGSEAYRGAADTLIEASVVRGEYFVRIHTRTASDMSRMQIEIDFEGGDVMARDPLSADIAVACEKIVEFLWQKIAPQTEAEIRKGVEARTKILNMALREAVRQEKVTRTGAGGKRDPFRYGITDGNNGNNEEHE